MATKSEEFSIVVQKKVTSGEMIKIDSKTMYITKIKSVEITEDGELLVEGLCKEDPISNMMRKYSRNK